MRALTRNESDQDAAGSVPVGVYIPVHLLLVLVAASAAPAEDLAANGICRLPIPVVGDVQLGDARARRLGQALASFGEQELATYLEDSRVVVRFFWLRSFDDPVVVRIELGEHSDDTISVKVGHDEIRERYENEVAKCLEERDRAALFRARYVAMREWMPCTLIRDDTVPVNLVDRRRLEEAIEAAGLDDESRNDDERRGMDGATWFFEYTDGTRATLSGVSLPRSGPLRDLGALMLQIGEVQVRGRDLY